MRPPATWWNGSATEPAFDGKESMTRRAVSEWYRIRRAPACRKSPAAPAFSARCLRNVCAGGANSPPARQSRAIRIDFGGDGGKRQPSGLLPPKVAKRPEGVNRNERRTRPAAVATIEVADLRALQTSRKGFVSGLRRAVSEWYRIRRARVFEKIRFRVRPYSAVATAAACWPAIWPETNVQDCAWPPQGV